MAAIASPSSIRNRGSGAYGPVERQLARLTSLRPGPHRIVSCYLKVEPRDRARGKYLIKLKNRVKAVEQGLARLGLDRATNEAVRADLARIQDYLKVAANLPASQGIAVFACGPLGLFEVVALPRVHRSRLGVDSSALVKELTAIEDEFGRMLVAVMDRTSAAFFEVTAFGAKALGRIESESTRGGRFHSDRDRAPGWGEYSYHNRIREEKHRHSEAIAQRLFELNRQQPADGIVLAGIGPDTKGVEPFLHPYLASRFMGITRLNLKEATVGLVYGAALEVRNTFERASEQSAVAEMREGIGTGWAVNGIRATLKALSRGQVRTLLVHPDAAEAGFRCAGSGRLVLTEAEARGEGAPVPVLDVIDDAIEDGLRQRVQVDVIYDTEAANDVSGLAALLRFR